MQTPQKLLRRPGNDRLQLACNLDTPRVVFALLKARRSRPSSFLTSAREISESNGKTHQAVNVPLWTFNHGVSEEFGQCTSLKLTMQSGQSLIPMALNGTSA